MPVYAYPYRGFACGPFQEDATATLFFWLVLAPMAGFIPAAYALYLLVLTWYKGLWISVSRSAARRWTARGLERSVQHASRSDLAFGTDPKSLAHKRREQQARSLAIYFARIFASVILMWCPAALLIFVLDYLDPWLFWFGATWTHLQGPVSVALAVMKPDVRQAVFDLFRPCLLYTSPSPRD